MTQPQDECPGWQDEEYDCTPDNPCTSCWHSGRYDRTPSEDGMSILEQYVVVGDNDADGDSVYLHCKRCPVDNPIDSTLKNIGKPIKRFPTNHWDDEPTIATLQDLFRAAREHDAKYHGSFTGHPAQADTGEINVIRGRE